MTATGAATQIAEFERSVFGAPLSSGRQVSHDVYARGQGPPVVVIQELPGIGQETLRLADKLALRGFRVVLPHLFGPLGRTSMVGNVARVLCLRREFRLFQAGRSSPVVDWLRALCRQVRGDCGVAGVGVIGMCLTGNFAITLMGDESVLAAVASQPSLPAMRAKALPMSGAEIAQTRARIDATAPMLALRFEKDKLCSAARFECIAGAFNEPDRERVRLRTLPGPGHSVLTIDFVDEAGHPTHAALEEVLGYLEAQLGPPS